jgi:hypothetical protein
MIGIGYSIRYVAGLIIGVGGLLTVLALGFFAVWLNTKDKFD